MDHFEELLNNRDDIFNNKKKDITVLANDTNTIQQKADKSASIFDLIQMIDKLITLTMPKVKFLPDEGKILDLDMMSNFDEPVITYKVINRKPKAELKPRVRETIVEKVDNGEARVGEVYGQKFECLIQFNIFASVYSEAEEVMEKFEELITTYTGFFKKNGVAELFFKEHATDDFYQKLRETLSIRNLIYYVEIEKLTVIFKEKIKEIEILAQKKEEI